MSRPAALVLITVCNVLGGLSYTWQGLAMAPAPGVTGLPPVTVIALRNVVATVCLVVWMAAARRVRAPAAARVPRSASGASASGASASALSRFTPAERRRLVLVGLVAFALPLVLGVIGVRWSTTQNGSILILLEPAAILVFAWWLLGERVRAVQVLGVAFGLAGAFALVLGEVPAGGLLAGLATGEHLLGNVVLAIHGVLWGLFTPLVKPLAERHDANAITLGILGASLLALVPCALLEHELWPDARGWAASLPWVVVLGVLVSFFGTVGWALALSVLRASSVAAFIFLQPLAGVIGGAWLMDETLAPHALLGGILIAIGVLLVAVLGARRPAPRVADARRAPGPGVADAPPAPRSGVTGARDPSASGAPYRTADASSAPESPES